MHVQHKMIHENMFNLFNTLIDPSHTQPAGHWNHLKRFESIHQTNQQKRTCRISFSKTFSCMCVFGPPQPKGHRFFIRLKDDAPDRVALSGKSPKVVKEFGNLRKQIDLVLNNKRRRRHWQWPSKREAISRSTTSWSTCCWLLGQPVTAPTGSGWWVTKSSSSRANMCNLDSYKISTLSFTEKWINQNYNLTPCVSIVNPYALHLSFIIHVSNGSLPSTCVAFRLD